MARKIKISPLAENDILDIALHISSENPIAAGDLIDEINDKFSLLLTQPEMGRKRPEFGRDLRSFAFRNYMIFYDPIPDGIFIVRVLHGARDIESVF